jgi:alpha-tubulin suppressor-like RCC1 family protein
MSPASELVPATTRCWGDNAFKQLGIDAIEPLGPVTPMPVIASEQLALGRSHGCAITDVGVQCWGAAERGQLGALASIDVSMPVLVGGIR